MSQRFQVFGTSGTSFFHWPKIRDMDRHAGGGHFFAQNFDFYQKVVNLLTKVEFGGEMWK